MTSSDQQSAPQSGRDWILGLVSHELRNSLAAITVAGTALTRGAGPSAAAVIGSRILVSAGRMDGIIRDLLDLGMVAASGSIEINRTPANGHEICRRIVGELETAHPGRQIRLHIDGDATGYWDSDRLEQVVSNLVANALQYGAEDAPVSIVSEGSETHWTVSVHNLGDPIPPDDVPHLFDPFKRGSGQRHTGRRNLGIGLFIVRQVVLAHGGNIQVTSPAMEGTRFVVTLPRIRTQSSSSDLHRSPTI
jgi:sigma-B regulation protein RsbU (phosphoserine phosphatase)